MSNLTRYFPWIQFLETHHVMNVATLFGLGRYGIAPGTLGAAAGLLWYLVFFHWSPPLVWLILFGLSCYAAIAFCHEAEARLYQEDPQEVILDEVVAVPLVFLFIPFHTFNEPTVYVVLLAGFGLFRFFDILKPLGIARLQKLEGGLGVVADDLAAALAACLTLHLGLIGLHEAGIR
ncbi:MAG: phosphatidylglycerophosphatase A [Opitutales bacterium]